MDNKAEKNDMKDINNQKPESNHPAFDKNKTNYNAGD